MKCAQLVHGADRMLWRKAMPVRRITAGVRKAFDQMAELMEGLQGIGIAGPQIGFGARCCIVDDSDGERVKMINPVIAWQGPSIATFREGCLSFAGVFLLIERHQTVTVRYLALDGTGRERGFHGLSAACAQHEIDHLNGILFFTRANQQGIDVAPKEERDHIARAPQS